MIRSSRWASWQCRRIIPATQTQAKNPAWISWCGIIAGSKVGNDVLFERYRLREGETEKITPLSLLSFVWKTAFRGLGRILGAARQISDGLAIPSLLNFTERAQLDTRGYVTRKISFSFLR